MAKTASQNIVDIKRHTLLEHCKFCIGALVVIGMGVGFIVEALIDRVHVERRNSETLTQGRRVISSIVLMLIDTGFILGELYMAGLIIVPEYLWRNIGAFILIAIGLGFLVAVLRSLGYA